MTYTISTPEMWGLAALVLWELIWKGFALWRAATREQPIWFVVLLVLNTAGLLSIFYILTHPPRKHIVEEEHHDQHIPKAIPLGT